PPGGDGGAGGSGHRGAGMGGGLASDLRSGRAPPARPARGVAAVPLERPVPPRSVRRAEEAGGGRGAGGPLRAGAGYGRAGGGAGVSRVGDVPDPAVDAGGREWFVVASVAANGQGAVEIAAALQWREQGVEGAIRAGEPPAEQAGAPRQRREGGREHGRGAPS